MNFVLRPMSWLMSFQSHAKWKHFSLFSFILVNDLKRTQSRALVRRNDKVRKSLQKYSHLEECAVSRSIKIFFFREISNPKHFFAQTFNEFLRYFKTSRGKKRIFSE